MPELPVREVRLPELHLPEIDRDQIVNALSGIRLPEIDLPSVGRQEGEERPRFDWRAIDWPDVDLGPALAGAAALARLGSRTRPLVRSRWALAAGVVLVTSVAAAAILAQPAVRERAGRTFRGVRDGVRERLGSDGDQRLDVDADLADTEADVETVATEVVTAADVATESAEAAMTEGAADDAETAVLAEAETATEPTTSS